MDTRQIAAALRSEIIRLQQALALIEGTSVQKRRGRPPKEIQALPLAPTPGTRRPFSAATKRKMAMAQKKRWAEKKKAAAKD
jgi:hypothetical protein